MCLFVLTKFTKVTDGRTDTAWRKWFWGHAVKFARWQHLQWGAEQDLPWLTSPALCVATLLRGTASFSFLKVMDLAAHFVAHYLVSKIIPNSLNQRRDRHSSIHHLVSMSPPGQTGGQRHYVLKLSVRSFVRPSVRPLVRLLANLWIWYLDKKLSCRRETARASCHWIFC